MFLRRTDRMIMRLASFSFWSAVNGPERSGGRSQCRQDFALLLGGAHQAIERLGGRGSFLLPCIAHSARLALCLLPQRLLDQRYQRASRDTFCKLFATLA